MTHHKQDETGKSETGKSKTWLDRILNEVVLQLLTTHPTQKSKFSPPKSNPWHNNPRHGNLLLTHVRPSRHGSRQETRTHRPPHHQSFILLRRLWSPRDPPRTRGKHHPLRLCSMPQRPLWHWIKWRTSRQAKRHLRARKPVSEDSVRVPKDSRCSPNL